MNFLDKVVFNEDDVIRHNDYVAYVSIAFLQESKPRDISLYIISPTMDANCFQVIHRYRIPEERELNNYDQGRIVLPDTTLYLEAGQFLAVSFGLYLGSPKHVTGRNHYVLGLGEVDTAYERNIPVTFDKHDSQVAISFHLVPTEG
jgi:hypothetical protein